jgi:hypothetical protein
MGFAILDFKLFVAATPRKSPAQREKIPRLGSVYNSIIGVRGQTFLINLLNSGGVLA